MTDVALHLEGNGRGRALNASTPQEVTDRARGFVRKQTAPCGAVEKRGLRMMLRYSAMMLDFRGDLRECVGPERETALASIEVDIK